MKTRKFKVIGIFSLEEQTGIVFNVNERQIGLCHRPEFINFYDLRTGGNILKFQDNDMLRISDEDMIEFGKCYISKITTEQWVQGEQKCKTEKPLFEFPINKRFRV